MRRAIIACARFKNVNSSSRKGGWGVEGVGVVKAFTETLKKSDCKQQLSCCGYSCGSFNHVGPWHQSEEAARVAPLVPREVKSAGFSFVGTYINCILWVVMECLLYG